MTARVAVLIILSFIFGATVLHEQPISSLMSASKFFVWVRQILRDSLQGGWYEEVTWMGAYGHSLQKPTQLLCTDDMVYRLTRTLTPEQRARCDAAESCVVLPCDSGSLRRRCAGVPKGLKASQEYPWAFAETIYNEWCHTRLAKGVPQYADVDSDEDLPMDAWMAASRECAWDELRLDDLATLLNIPADRLLP